MRSFDELCAWYDSTVAEPVFTQWDKDKASWDSELATYTDRDTLIRFKRHVQDKRERCRSAGNKPGVTISYKIIATIDARLDVLPNPDNGFKMIDLLTKVRYSHSSSAKKRLIQMIYQPANRTHLPEVAKVALSWLDEFTKYSLRSNVSSVSERDLNEIISEINYVDDTVLPSIRRSSSSGSASPRKRGIFARLFGSA